MHRNQGMSKDSFGKGLQKHRKVMGDAFVDRALFQADELTMPMQDFVTRVAWDAIWSREAFSDRDHSLINLRKIAAWNRPHKFKGHARGALNRGALSNGVSSEKFGTSICKSLCLVDSLPDLIPSVMQWK